MKYKMQHVDVEELDCPKPGTKKVMPKAIKENIRRNKKKVRLFRDVPTDTLSLVPIYPK